MVNSDCNKNIAILSFIERSVYMKKTWVAPEIEFEVLSATAFNLPEGLEPDGYYLDWETCDDVPVYPES